MNVVTLVRMRESSIPNLFDGLEDLKLEHTAWPRWSTLLLNGIGFYVSIKKAVYRLCGQRPRINCLWVDGLSKTSRLIKEGAATWRALNLVYNFNPRGEGPNVISRWFDRFWLRIPSAQAPRNRLKMARCALVNAARERAYGTDEVVRILSLASGSAQAVIETIAILKKEQIRVEAYLVDSDPTAAEHAMLLANRWNVADQIVAATSDLFRFEQLVEGRKSHIVEMMGLLDYLEPRVATFLFKRIHRHLLPDGYLFVSQVHPNQQEYFLRTVVDWKHMFHRTATEVTDLYTSARFRDIRVKTEPLGIQCFGVGRR